MRLKRQGFPRGLRPEGKTMFSMINKTGKFDAQGLNKLQRASTLPEVWIPQGEIQDTRASPYPNVLLNQRSRLKHRVHSTLAKYGIVVSEMRSLFGVKGREDIGEKLSFLPPETRFVTEHILFQIEVLDEEIKAVEERMKTLLSPTKEIELLESLPQVGFILATVMAQEAGDIERFKRPENLASYAGLVPRVAHGRTRTTGKPLLKVGIRRGRECHCFFSEEKALLSRCPTLPPTESPKGSPKGSGSSGKTPEPKYLWGIEDPKTL